MVAMFEEHYKDGSFAGEKSRNVRLYLIRVGIVVAICAVSLAVVGYQKWARYALHNKLMKRHAEAVAYYDGEYRSEQEGGKIVYKIGYTFMVGEKTYHTFGTLTTRPTSPEGIVYYDPDDPDQSELGP